MPVLEKNAVQNIIGQIAPDIIATRHHLHQNPELSYQEEKTSALIAGKLRALNLDTIRTGVGGFGIVADLKGAHDGPIFALRGDMDALPIQETAAHEYTSRVPGVMHACGHDGHTSNLLGAATTLAQMRDAIHGTIRFIFQPAEEMAGGAEKMCSEGAMDGVSAIVALHGWPGLDIGQIGVRSGPMMASSDNFDLTVRGRGAHAAMPHNSVDPIVTAAHLVLALQSLAGREISPVEPVVVTVAQFHAGTAYNIIPDEAHLKGTVRCLTEALRRGMAERIERIAQGVAAAFRAEIGFTYRYGTGVTNNDPRINALVTGIGTELLGAENVISLDNPSMGAEDFAEYLKYAPGAMFRLGVGCDVTPLHTPTYNFSDAALPHGIALFVHLALRFGKEDSRQ